MIACPHCQQPLQVNNAAEYNVDAYRKPVLAVTLCCGKGVVLRAVTTIVPSPYVGDNDVDGWGNPIKPTSVDLLPHYGKIDSLVKQPVSST